MSKCKSLIEIYLHISQEMKQAVLKNGVSLRRDFTVFTFTIFSFPRLGLSFILTLP